MDIITKYIEYKQLQQKLDFFQKYININEKPKYVMFSLDNITNFKNVIDNTTTFVTNKKIKWLILGFSNSENEMKRLNSFLKGTDIICHGIDEYENEDNEEFQKAKESHEYKLYQMNFNTKNDEWNNIIDKYDIIAYDIGVIHLSKMPRYTLIYNIRDKLSVYGVFYCPINIDTISVPYTIHRYGANIIIADFGVNSMKRLDEQSNIKENILYTMLNMFIQDNVNFGANYMDVRPIKYIINEYNYEGYRYKDIELQELSAIPDSTIVSNIGKEIMNKLVPYYYIYNICMLKYIFGSIKLVYKSNDLIGIDNMDFTECMNCLKLINIQFDMNDIINNSIYEYPFLPDGNSDTSKIKQYYVITKTHDNYNIDDINNLHRALIYCLFCTQRWEIRDKIENKIKNRFEDGINSRDDIINKAKEFLGKMSRKY